MDYEYENGRRYHAYEAGRYHLPNDEQEASRLDLQHQIWYLTLGGKLYKAPIDGDKISNALDIGTGTGLWAIEFADKHPNCHVVGTDLSPIQPNLVPPNCEFIVDDADADREWGFGPIDYIHSRLLSAGFKGWKEYIARCYANLVPGGWIELHEIEFPLICDDGSVDKDDPVMKWSLLIDDAGTKAGFNFREQRNFTTYLEAAGFTHITKEDHQWPIGPWQEGEDQSKIGVLMMANAVEMINSGKAFLTRQKSWSTEEYDKFAEQCKASIEDASKHRYYATTVHYAQKPLASASSTSFSAASTVKEDTGV